MTTNAAIQAAKTMISREFDACRRPNIAEIAGATGLLPTSIEVLIDEVRAARQTPRQRPKPAAPVAAVKPAPVTTTAAATVTTSGQAGIDLAWLDHPVPRVRKAAKRAMDAITAAVEAIAAEAANVEAYQRREQLLAELADLDKQLGGKTACPDCGRAVSSTGMRLHARRSKAHATALAKAGERKSA
jgi:enamine deaminase RidA (YjgF/YER057c/UK114 family)